MDDTLHLKKIIGDYSYCLKDQIGKGYSSFVYKGKNEKTGEIVAIKAVEMSKIKNEIERSLLNQEIYALSIMKSPNILQMKECYQTPNNTYIITEYCNQGDLATMIKKKGPLPEAEAVRYLRHIANGFKEQIRKGVIHRDLKPSNIFLRNGICKIADYGFSKMLNITTGNVYYNVGSPLYMCPQSLIQNQYTEKSDIWSIGILFYELLFDIGYVPWVGKTDQEIAAKIYNVPINFDPSVPLSEDAKDLILRLLHPDEVWRISVKELDSHPLLQQCHSRYLSTLQRPRSIQTNDIQEIVNTEESNSCSKQTNKKTIYDYSQNALLNNLPSSRILKHHKPQKSLQLQGDEITQSTNTSLTPSEIASTKITNCVKHISNSKEKPKVYSQRAQYFEENDNIISFQLNFCKLLFRIIQLIDMSQLNKMEALKLKLRCMAMKAVMIKISKLEDMIDKGQNTFKIQKFGDYLEGNGIAKFLTTFREQSKKYNDYFKQMANEITLTQSLYEFFQADQDLIKIQNLDADKFQKVLEETLNNFIPKLTAELDEQMAFIENDLTPEAEVHLLLLDYLLFFFQLIKVHFEITSYTKETSLQLIADGKPIKLDKIMFEEIKEKIKNLI